MQLPVMEVLDQLRKALDDAGAAVLVAPPGTGKTTGVPPALLSAPWAAHGRIVMLQPRRLAARAAARRMADVRGERVGQTFGHAVRGERKVGPATRVEVVTEGLLVRRMQADPSLEGVAAVILDEFHERSLDTDLALALLLDLRESLRPDLRLLVMSATLDPAPVAELLGRSAPDGAQAGPVPVPVPVIEATAPIHPVEVRYRPGSAHDPIEQRVAAVIVEALRNDPGDVLVFLPGRAEIRRTRRELERLVTVPGVAVHELHGSMRAAEQDAVLRPADPAAASGPGGGRRVVLSTSLAETSITVPGVRVVVDAGRRRTSLTDARTGLPALVTTANSRASADQRTGRAGRTAPGVSYRLWSKEDERHRPAADTPELLMADLSSLLLQVRAWGVDDPRDLVWSDPPPGDALAAAAELLNTLGALDPGGRLTRRGRQLAQIGFHPRLAAVALEGRATGAEDLAADLLAVLETNRAGDIDAISRVAELRSGRATDEVRRAAREWRRTLGVRSPSESPGAVAGDVDELVGRLLLAGFPDRVARRRRGGRTDDRGRPLAVYHLRTGGEVTVPEPDHLARSEWLVVPDLHAGTAGRPGRAHLAAVLDPDTVRDAFRDEIEHRDEVRWDPRECDVVARRTEVLGAITLAERPLPDPDPIALSAALREGLHIEGIGVLRGLERAAELRSRVACLRVVDGADRWPDWSDAALERTLEDWLGPWLGGLRRRADLDRVDVRRTLEAMLDHRQQRELRDAAPTHWELASGRRVHLRYGEVDGEPGTVLASVRLRDAYGTDVHPTVGAGRVPVTVELLSPAGRPVQRTTDLPGFWRGSYAQVRSELRGRYPKHPWPERPWEPPPPKPPSPNRVQ